MTMFVVNKYTKTRAIHMYSESQWWFFKIVNVSACSWRMEMISMGRNERGHSK